MAILECSLCGDPVRTPIPSDHHVFCCHACKQLFELLGESQVEQLKSQPGVHWDMLRNLPSNERTRSLAEATDPRTVQWTLSGVWCPSCCILIEQVLKRQPGVVGVRTDFAQSTAEVMYDGKLAQDVTLAREVEKLGYKTVETSHVEIKDDGPMLDLQKRLVVSAILTFFMMMLSVPVWTGYLKELPRPLELSLSYGLLALATPVVFWSGWPFLRGGFASLTRRVPTMDLLISIGSLGAYLYSILSLIGGHEYLYFDTSGLLVTFLLLSRVLEATTRDRATAALGMVERLLPRQARRLAADGQTTMVGLETLRAKDQIVVQSGEVVPIDGRIASGSSEMDEAVLTGESARVSKHVHDLVYAGTTHHGPTLVVDVMRADETLLAQTVSYVRRAQENSSIWKRLADRILAIFVPTILILALATFFGALFLLHLPFGTSLLRAIAVLVIGCPCALSIATPVALIGSAEALSTRGVLLRSPDAIERAEHISTVLFDKTGTVTTGRMQMHAIWPDSEWRAPEWLALAASAEFPAEHPIASAIVRYAETRQAPVRPVSDFQVESGWGVRGVVDGKRIEVGMAPEQGEIPQAWQDKLMEWQQAGLTTVHVMVDGQVVGLLSLASEVRQEAAEVVAQFRQAGVKVALISGDHATAVSQVAAAVGMDTWHARQSPFDKAAKIRELQAQGEVVCFIGDGVNDGPALVEANLGIAMGSSADIALEAGHLILANNRLQMVPEALQTIRLTSRVIRQNLLWALAYNVVAQVVAISGLATPALAAGAMVASSLFVLGNSLRVVGWSPWHYVRRIGAVATALCALLAIAYFQI
ncbi:cation-translocating P-type ATPase [Alicyclobacillus sp. SP_1]|jgi:heavy metal translocating P-type ATPase|uniref:heavy metal translocating P-type ATPase n=1 Tax=Alicyclobacillus sp. SP_1 TaxID=2942475 RepID=UPI002157AAF8|nr:cation-translocating P-type ATPase [Alicyclobacillus sp. SP_1]